MTPSDRSLGPAWGYASFYLFIRCGGRRAAYALLQAVCAFYVLFRSQVRQGCLPYLRQRFPHDVGLVRLLQIYRMVLAFGTVLVDRAIAGLLGPEQLRVSLAGRAQLLALRDQRRGMVLMMSHVGCWQVAMSALDFLEQPVAMLMQPDTRSRERHYHDYRGGERPWHLIDPAGYLGGALEMMAVLKQGGILSVMGDRLPPHERNRVRVTFLGRPVDLPYSAFQLASATGAPVVVMFSRKSSADSYEMALAETIEVPAGLGRRPEAYRPYVQRYADLLATYCHDNPYQFFNFFDLWQSDAGQDAVVQQK
ncbi:MAG: lipid A biosynthesis acyltransferase [Desulfuromonadaceae bacterium]|nr:lipid A biosynthesis acyltransferase [Desulfuromonadaceae bacterium]